jgi:hypothetical protein
MKPRYTFPTLFFFLLCLNVIAQTNAGMPLAKDMAIHFLSQYQAPDNGFYFKFEKRSEGWFVYQFSMWDGTQTSPQLFWDKKNRQYLLLHFRHQDSPDSTTTIQTLSDYAQKSILTAEDMKNYDRNLYYGYDNWDWDVMKTLEIAPLTTDSLMECLANAYCQYAWEYFLTSLTRIVTHNDPDRGPLNDSLPFPLSRLKKFISYDQKAIHLYQKIYKLNSRYQCTNYDIRCRVNNEAMGASYMLNILGYNNLRAPLLQEIAFPDSVLQHAQQILNSTSPEGIVFTDADTASYPLQYLQIKGFRNDVIIVNCEMLLLKRDIAYLDQKYHHRLFTVLPSIYLDSAFGSAILQPGNQNAKDLPVDSFLNALYISPETKGLPDVDSSLGKVYRFFTQQLYFSIDSNMAKKFFKNSNIRDTISLTLTNNYLSIEELLELDIIQKNLLSRHIYFTNPSNHLTYLPYCQKRSEHLWEFTAGVEAEK